MLLKPTAAHASEEQRHMARCMCVPGLALVVLPAVGTARLTVLTTEELLVKTFCSWS